MSKENDIPDLKGLQEAGIEDGVGIEVAPEVALEASLAGMEEESATKTAWLENWQRERDLGVNITRLGLIGASALNLIFSFANMAGGGAPIESYLALGAAYGGLAAAAFTHKFFKKSPQE